MLIMNTDNLLLLYIYTHIHNVLTADFQVILDYPNSRLPRRLTFSICSIPEHPLGTLQIFISCVTPPPFLSWAFPLSILTPTVVAWVYSVHPPLWFCPHDKTETAETEISKLGTEIVHHDTSPTRSKGQGHRVNKSWWDSHVAPSRSAVTPLNKTPARPAWVMHSIECPASSSIYLRRCTTFNYFSILAK